MKKALRTLLVFVLSLALSISFSAHSLAMQTTPTEDSPAVLTEGDIWYYNFETGESGYEFYDTSENTRTAQRREPYCPPNVPNALETANDTRALYGDHVGVWAHSYPYCAVGMIEYWVDLDGNNFLSDEECLGLGTAFLIAEDVILTAAHCVWNAAYEDEDVRIYFYPGLNGLNDSYRTTYSTRVITRRVPSDYKNSPETSLQDWAICRIADNRGDTFGWFGLCNSVCITLNLEVSLSGYPQGVEAGGEYPASVVGCQYKSTGQIISRVRYQFESTNYIISGYSGGPVYDANGFVYGIAVATPIPQTIPRHTLSTCFETNLYNKIVEECDAAAARWS